MPQKVKTHWIIIRKVWKSKQHTIWQLEEGRWSNFACSFFFIHSLLLVLPPYLSFYFPSASQSVLKRTRGFFPNKCEETLVKEDPFLTKKDVLSVSHTWFVRKGNVTVKAHVYFLFLFFSLARLPSFILSFSFPSTNTIF